MTGSVLNLRLSGRRNIASLFAAFGIVLVVGLSIGFHQQIKNQLNAWKLLPEPEKLTELYFTHPNNLPASYVIGQPQTVSFTAHNLEYQAETYRYKIVEENQAGSESKTLAAGSFTLQQNQYKDSNVTVMPANLGPRARITVELPTVNETIDYWVIRDDK